MLGLGCAGDVTTRALMGVLVLFPAMVVGSVGEEIDCVVAVGID